MAEVMDPAGISAAPVELVLRMPELWPPCPCSPLGEPKTEAPLVAPVVHAQCWTDESSEPLTEVDPQLLQPRVDPVCVGRCRIPAQKESRVQPFAVAEQPRLQIPCFLLEPRE